ncbi:MAG: Nif3-like dinuclear metal center hexameric protein [Patescibacteria group bacterium]
MSHGEILAVLEELAPAACADPGDAPGFEIRAGETCRRIGVCVDPTERNLYLAATDGADLVITHHPWRGEAEEVVRAKGISIYRLHSAWDYAPEGNAVTLARMLGLRDLVLAEGALTGVTDLPLRALIERCQRVTGRNILPYAGDLSRRVQTVGIIPGSGFLPIFHRRWEALLASGCDTVISGEISHTALRLAETRGVNLVDLSHSGVVKPGLAHLAYLLKCRLVAHECEAYFYDDLYAVNYYTAWSLPRQEEAEPDKSPGGVVVPFSR